MNCCILIKTHARHWANRLIQCSAANVMKSFRAVLLPVLFVQTVENGQMALEVFQASDPGYYDAILMDIQMPVMNGYDATSAIRGLERSDAQIIPIVAMTADAFAADVIKARSAGMNDHIAKPIDINRLLEVLQNCLM